eukprot:GHVT01059774.1.p1 GENE.GHVT01059774.1~~GHVT01059774.1.p1  ORF type:complete len:309 (-),score=81.79 GHVT01059774.1:61-987(-)
MSRAAYKRLRIEQRSLEHDPPPFVVARPEEDDLLKWHFVLHGLPADTPYAGGVYHGMLIFPAEYPFRPPAIKIFTPNGRFAVNTRLCFSMSDYHPETWQVSWKVSTILTGFVSFMLDSADPSTTGSVQSSAAQRRALALSSFGHNISWPTFSRLFPEFSDASSFNPVHGYRLKQPSAPSSSSTSSSASSSSSPGCAAPPGPRIDVALLPIGGYKPSWRNRLAHKFNMTPEEAIQAHKDLNARCSIATYHDTFPLGGEAYGEAAARLSAAAAAAGLQPGAFLVPRPGEALKFKAKLLRHYHTGLVGGAP